MNHNMTSLCIPRINRNINKNDIIKRFNELQIGNIEKVDIIFKNNEKGDKFYSAFIHIQWNDSELSKYIIDRVTNGKDIKVIYDGLMFWKVYINKSNKNKHSFCDSVWERKSKI